jgi:hypothetical protein
MSTFLEPKQNVRVYGLAYGLWILSSVLSVFASLAGRAMIIRTYSRFFPLDAWRFQSGQGSLSLLNILVSFPLVAMMIVIIIGGFEYQHRYMGQPGAWQFLARTLAIECGILLLALFV